MLPFAIQPKLFGFLITFVAVTALSSIYYITQDRQVELRVSGMHCKSCVGSVKKSLAKLPGVKSVEIVFPYEEPAGCVSCNDSRTNSSATEPSATDTTPSEAAPTKAKPNDAEPVGQVKLLVDYFHKPSEDEINKAVGLAGDYQVKFVQK